ncbi:MAG: SDR family oxidoreductase [Acidobacteria bacterium]|nr:SDR family oxidoreductase [Acidobacteriota bacterium]
MVSIQDQIAVVTGGGRGIGRAIAVELGKLGARVVLAARGREELEQTAKIIGPAASVMPTDVRKKEEIERLFEHAGAVDILVNAAGLGIFGPVVDFKDEDFDVLIETNLRGIFFACRFALPSMIERKKGHIINIASIAGKVGSANRAVYCASKFGVVGFTQSLAEEVRQHGIRVSLICPGSTDTRFSPAETSGKARERMLRPEDVAHAVRAIVTQEPNSFISEIILRPTRKP